MLKRRPSVFDYSDYRRYLTDLFQFKKKSEDNEYTYRKFARFCGFDTDAGIRHVLSGRRNLTRPRLSRMAECLPLNRGEKGYFLDLVRWNQARDINETVLHFDRMSKHLIQCYVNHVKSSRAEIFLSKWYHLIIHEMVQLEGFNPDPAWISKRCCGAITPDEARDAMDVLVKYNFVKKQQGCYVVTDKNVKFESGIALKMLDLLHIQGMSKSINAIKEVDPKDRSIHTMVVSLDENKHAELNEYLRDCLIHFMRESNRVVAPKDVYQCSVQFFKVTRGV